MKLNDKQLEAIKLKIETEKIGPTKAIRAFLKEETHHIRKQLFRKYNKEELKSHAKPAEETK